MMVSVGRHVVSKEGTYIERFKHLGYASFFLLHVGVNIEVERCGDVRMTQ